MGALHDAVWLGLGPSLALPHSVRLPGVPPGGACAAAVGPLRPGQGACASWGSLRLAWRLLEASWGLSWPSWGLHWPDWGLGKACIIILLGGGLLGQGVGTLGVSAGVQGDLGEAGLPSAHALHVLSQAPQQLLHVLPSLLICSQGCLCLLAPGSVVFPLSLLQPGHPVQAGFELVLLHGQRDVAVLGLLLLVLQCLPCFCQLGLQACSLLNGACDL